MQKTLKVGLLNIDFTAYMLYKVAERISETEIRMPEVRLEETIYLLPRDLIVSQREGRSRPGTTWGEYNIPSDAPNSVALEHYHGYRRGKAPACADIIAWTMNADGVPAAILTFRKEGVCFEKKWWIQGGAVEAFTPISDFVARCAQRESGALPIIEALVGFFRTTEFVEGEEKRQVSTLQSAHIGYVHPTSLVLKADANHTSAVLMTEEMYTKVPEEEKHWYPTLLMQILFDTMPTT